MKALESVGEKLRVTDAVVDLISALFDPLEVIIGDVEIHALSEHFLDEKSQDHLSDENILALIELEKMLCGEPNVPSAIVYHAFDRLIE